MIKIINKHDISPYILVQQTSRPWGESPPLSAAIRLGVRPVQSAGEICPLTDAADLYPSLACGDKTVWIGIDPPFLVNLVDFLLQV